jgi:hypothetical protein
MIRAAVDPFTLLADAALERMIERGWYDAARAWSEARAYRAGAPDRLGRFPADALLRSAAESADAYWYRLIDERNRRKDAPRMTNTAAELAAADMIRAAADTDPGEANEPALHALNGREADHYAGGKPAVCDDCAAMLPALPADPTARRLAAAVDAAQRAHRAADAAYTEAQRAMHDAESARNAGDADARHALHELRAYVRALIHRADAVTVTPADYHGDDTLSYSAAFGWARASTSQSTPGYSAKPKPRHATASAWWIAPAGSTERAMLYDSGRGTSDPVKLAAAVAEAQAAALAWAQERTAAAWLRAHDIDPDSAPDPAEILTATPRAVVQWYGADIYWTAEWHMFAGPVDIGMMPAHDLPDATRDAIAAALREIEPHGANSDAARAALAPFTPAVLAAWIERQ